MAKGSTIVALSTAEGASALAVVRLSGPEAITITSRCFSRQLQTQPSHTLQVGKILDGDKVLDEVVVALFRSPRSYTGEDLVEISCHGSPYIVRRLLQLLCDSGAKVAEAGEFTKRAFLHKKLDLVEAEGVASLIAAESEAAHRVARQQMRGGVSQQIRAFREDIMGFAAQIELELDFSEEDLRFAERDELASRLRSIQEKLQQLLLGFTTAQAFKEGVDVVIAGPPNAGKSTLFNALVAEEKAIVSSIPGTTRDYIEGYLDVHGIRFRLSDTAGLRDSTDSLEQEGVRRTHRRIAAAQLLLLVVDLSVCIEEELIELRRKYTQDKRPFMLLGNKVDLLNKRKKPAYENQVDMVLSAKKKSGIQLLREKIHTRIVGQAQRPALWISELRHYELLQQAEAALTRVQKGMASGQPSELLAADLREALRAFGQITGEEYSEALLSHIFSRFCIGK